MLNEPSSQILERTQKLEQEARKLGFDAFGVAKAGPPDPQERLKAWLEKNFHGDMDYMKRTFQARIDLEQAVPGAKSVVALAKSYYRPEVKNKGNLKIARYAMGKDYHKHLRKNVRKLRKVLIQLDPTCAVYPTVDTSPVLERAWAQRAGIAWIGKSTMAINPKLGTYTFLATLVTTSELAANQQLPDRCGSCTACIDSCPPKAILEPRLLDARKCISYQTLERPQVEELSPQTKLEGWVAGCDICQEVCPWNKFAHCTTQDDPSYEPIKGLMQPDEAVFTKPDHLETLNELIAKTALRRTGAKALQRNARHANESSSA